MCLSTRARRDTAAVQEVVAHRPNILLVVADCARSDRWVGPGRGTLTPNIDRLCREGVAFPTTITEQSCTTPSFAALSTGLYSPRHGVYFVWGYCLPEGVRMLTETLAERGYHAYAEVSGLLLPEMGLARAFERYEYRAPCDYLHTAWGDQFVERLGTGYYRKPWFLLLHLWELHLPRQIVREQNRPEFGRDEYERAVSSLDAQLTHVFGAVGDEALIIFTGDRGEKSEAETYQNGTAVPYACRLLGIHQAQGMALYQVGYWAGPSVLQQLYAQCTPMIKDLRLRDAQRRPRFGRWVTFRDRLRLLRLAPKLRIRDLLALGSPLNLTAMLKGRGLLDEARSRRKVKRFTRSLGRDELLDMYMRMTINCYKKHMHHGHGVHVYDYLVQVPLLMRWPGRLPGGLVCRRMVRQPDILPTVLELVSVDQGDIGEIDGRSFKPLLEARPWQSLPAYLSLPGLLSDLELRGVRTEEYKYTYGPENTELPEELYDLRRDPGEMRNLAGKEPERCAELRRLAASLVPADGAVPVEPMTVQRDQQQQVEKHLRELGYLD